MAPMSVVISELHGCQAATELLNRQVPVPVQPFRNPARVRLRSRWKPPKRLNSAFVS